MIKILLKIWGWARKIWKKRISKIVLGILFIIGIASNISGIMSFFDYSNKESAKKIIENTDARASEGAAISASISKELKETKKIIEESAGTNCSDFGDWINSDKKIKSTKNFIILDGQNTVGSISFQRSLSSNLFTLDILFIPSGISGINTTVSLKDMNNKELSLTIGDGDYQSVRLNYFNGEKMLKNLKGKIDPGIQPKTKVKVRLQSTLTQGGIIVSGMAIYIPYNKSIPTQPEFLFPDQIFKSDYLGQEINFSLGLKKQSDQGETGLRLIDCKIFETLPF